MIISMRRNMVLAMVMIMSVRATMLGVGVGLAIVMLNRLWLPPLPCYHQL